MEPLFSNVVYNQHVKEAAAFQCDLWRGFKHHVQWVHLGEWAVRGDQGWQIHSTGRSERRLSHGHYCRKGIKCIDWITTFNTFIRPCERERNVMTKCELCGQVVKRRQNLQGTIRNLLKLGKTAQDGNVRKLALDLRKLKERERTMGCAQCASFVRSADPPPVPTHDPLKNDGPSCNGCQYAVEQLRDKANHTVPRVQMMLRKCAHCTAGCNIQKKPKTCQHYLNIQGVVLEYLARVK